MNGKPINQPELIIRSDSRFALLVVFGVTGLCITAGYNLRKDLFDWKHFNPAGINTIIFLLLVLLDLLCWVKYFTNQPRLKIDKEGVWKQKHVFAHSLKLIVSWENISYYYVEVKPDRNISTENLVIQKKEPDEASMVNITDSDVSKEQILAVMKTYSEIYGFHDFVDELT